MDHTVCTTEEWHVCDGRRVARRAGLVGGLAVWIGVGAACGGGEPPNPIVEPPKALMCPSAQVQFCQSADAANAAREAASDARDRSAPALEDATKRTALTNSLTQLVGALGAGNITDARAALSASRTALGAASGQGADAPDLGAIELMLDHLAPLIGS